MVTKVKVDMKPVNQILKAKGLTAGGDVQQFHTANVLRRIVKYMPYRTGATIKLMQVQTDPSIPRIVLDVPHGKYIYHGKVMVDPVTRAAGFLTPNGWRSRKDVPKVLTDRDLHYTTTKNPQAGPYWDRRLVAAEGDAIASEIEEYIKSK